MRSRAWFPAVAVAVCAAAVCAASGSAAVPVTDQFQIATAGSQPAISWDARTNRYVGYVAPAGAHSGIYLVPRAAPYGTTGTPWAAGTATLATKSTANGDSFSPAFGGNDHYPPGCLVFASKASNLVSGDRDHHADVFVKPLPSGKLKRIQAKAAVTSVTVDAKCSKVAYIAGGRAYVQPTAGRSGGKAVSQGRATSAIAISGDASAITYVRSGSVYVGKVGHTPRSLGAGSTPTLDGFGRVVVFQSGTGVLQAPISSGAPTTVVQGSAPSTTSGGHFIFYGSAGSVFLNVHTNPVAACPAGDNVTGTRGSTHGNYVVFTCSDGGVYLGYVGGQ